MQFDEEEAAVSEDEIHNYFETFDSDSAPVSYKIVLHATHSSCQCTMVLYGRDILQTTLYVKKCFQLLVYIVL